mmetsp:Transcript_25021/g.27830  ORF Transcript_25021/g.27830 Transcript_25021/m.27830 type:complete len:244 (+) Transcript_25021:27-758(+)
MSYPGYNQPGYPPRPAASYQQTTTTYGVQPPRPAHPGGYQQTTTSYGNPASGVTRTTTTVFNNSWYAHYYHQAMQNQQMIYQLQSWFQSIDTDRSGTIAAQELAGVAFHGRPLGLPCAVKIIRAFDKDKSGSIDFREYVALHQFLTQMTQAFFVADADRSGSIDPREAWTAVSQAGFSLSQPTITALSTKFNNTGYGLSFEAFLMAMAHLAIVRSIFEWNDAARSGFVRLSFDQLAHITIECL